MVTPDGLAVDSGDARDLALGAATLEQRVDGGPLVGFQDIHSLASPRGRPELLSCQQVPAAPAFTPCPRSTQVGEFEVAISGGVWVAAGEYLAKFAGIHKVGTLERRLVSLHKAAIQKNLPSPVKTLPVQHALAGIRRTHGVRPRRVVPVVKDTLLEMLIVGEQTQNPVVFARDKAILLLAFCGALRRSEACALDVSDLRFLDGGMDVLIRRSKTDTDGQGHTIFIPKAKGNRCPVVAVTEWLEKGQITEGPVFRAVSRSDRVLPGALSAQSVALIVKRSAARIGANAEDFSGHSLRAGFCTEASTAGLANWQIRAVSRHVNDVHLATYVRPISNKTPSLL